MADSNLVRGYIDGSFDFFHSGHANILFAARSLCDHLTVGVATDAMHIKKKGRPWQHFEVRSSRVSILSCVDRVVPHTALDQTDYRELNIDIRFVGTDHGSWGEDQIMGLLWCIKNGIVVYPLRYTAGISSSEIREELDGSGKSPG